MIHGDAPSSASPLLKRIPHNKKVVNIFWFFVAVMTIAFSRLHFHRGYTMLLMRGKIYGKQNTPQILPQRHKVTKKAPMRITLPILNFPRCPLRLRVFVADVSSHFSRFTFSRN
jgi:hypothetical protein